ncbi:MAG TPA: hypothetical protein VFQ04_06745, partial [Actinomycetes bacterium]|nr:hypothetical protein [Actinomycetes bacterium]
TSPRSTSGSRPPGRRSTPPGSTRARSTRRSPATAGRPATAPTRPGATEPDTDDDSPSGDAEATQPVLGDATTETTQPGDKTEAIQPLAEDGSSGTANGEGQPGDQDTTQRLGAVGTTDNGGNRPQAPKPTAKEGKGRH